MATEYTKQIRREQIRQILEEKDINYVEYNGGHHWRCEDIGVDIWPGTYKWAYKNVVYMGMHGNTPLEEVLEMALADVGKEDTYKTERTVGLETPLYSGKEAPWTPNT